VIVAQGQSPGTGQAIDETPALDVFDVNAAGPLQGQGNAPWIAAGIGFLAALAGQQGRLVELVKRLLRGGMCNFLALGCKSPPR